MTGATLDEVAYTWGGEMLLFYFSDGIRLGWRKGTPKSTIDRYATVRLPELDAVDITPHIAVATMYLSGYDDKVPVA